MTFNHTVFERLLFPLNKLVYRQIQNAIDKIDREHTGKLQEIIDNFQISANRDTQTETLVHGKRNITFPTLNISVNFIPTEGLKISNLNKSVEYKIMVKYEENMPSEYTGSHLVVGYYQGETLHSFIVPLEYLLGFNKDLVLREGSYQLYSHTILSSGNQAIIKKELETIGENYSNMQSIQQFHRDNSFLYVGITKRTWQERYRQHCNDMRRGSNLLFHRALRGEFCRIGIFEHTVERAGLTKNKLWRLRKRKLKNAR